MNGSLRRSLPALPALPALLVLLAAPAAAQAPQQVVRPPQAQAWIDVATFAGMGMPMMGGGMGSGDPMAALGGLFGGRGAAPQVSFGMTQAGGAAASSTSRWRCAPSRNSPRRRSRCRPAS